MRESHPEKPELATMRVAREDEVRRPTGEVTEGARIVEHRDASHARAPRVLRADRLEVRAPVAEPEVEAEHLDGAGRRLHALHRVDEELDAGRRETIADMLRRLVVMVPEAGEASTLERGERRERLAKERTVAL